MRIVCYVFTVFMSTHWHTCTIMFIITNRLQLIWAHWLTGGGGGCALPCPAHPTAAVMKSPTWLSYSLCVLHWLWLLEFMNALTFPRLKWWNTFILNCSANNLCNTYLHMHNQIIYLAINFHRNYVQFIYERVAVGRKYPCSRPPWICPLWYLLQRLFHVQMGSNLNLGQSLYVQPLLLWLDDNLLAWSGAIYLYKKAIILAVNTAIYMVKGVLAGF